MSNFKFPVEDSNFKKSSWSKNNPKACVMVAVKEEGVALWDSKDDSKSTLFFNHEEWDAFKKGIASGDFK